jgi:His-Xaa-Ser system protein HxsD
MANSSNKEYSVRFAFNSAVYPKEALVSACYMFLDKYYIFLESRAGGKVEVMMKDKGGKKLSREKIAKIKDDFLNELLYNTARLDAAKRNKRLREFIVGRALFSAVENLEPEETAGTGNDPLGIAIPWEEKNKKSGKKAKK